MTPEKPKQDEKLEDGAESRSQNLREITTEDIYRRLVDLGVTPEQAAGGVRLALHEHWFSGGRSSVFTAHCEIERCLATCDMAIVSGSGWRQVRRWGWLCPVHGGTSPTIVPACDGNHAAPACKDQQCWRINDSVLGT